MPNLIEYITGSATTEQDLIVALEDFMLNVLTGWSVMGKITDSSSDKDYVFHSKGTVPGNYRDLYIRWRGYNNDVQIYGYQRWHGAADYDDEMYSASYTLMNCGLGPFTYWIFGDNDGVWLLTKNGADYYSGFGGYLSTYYCDDVDDLPVCVAGQTGVSSFFDSGRVYAYSPPSSASGTSALYYANKILYNDFLTRGEPNQRDGSVAHIPIIMYHSSTASQKELRGEMRHALWFAGNTLSSEDWVTISGTTYKYFISSYSADETIGFGPVPTTSGEWA